MKNYWNKLYKSGRKYSPVSEIVLDKLELSGKTALDIGCGTGELTRQLKARGFTVTGIDMSDVAIEAAKRIDRDILYLCGKFEQSALDGRYDVIVINKVLAFVDDMDSFVAKAKKLLAPNGKLIIITPVRYKQYMDKYDEHYLGISIGWKLLKDSFPNLEVVGTCYHGSYGCELTIVV